MMNKSLFALIAVLTLCQGNLLRFHDYWYTDKRAEAINGKIDHEWGYCDLKCLYLERYYPAYDFVYITFSQTNNKPEFGACFVVKVTSTGAKSYGLWNSVAFNDFFDTFCGKETEDYYAESQGQNPKFKVVSIKGEGKGTEGDY
jgi:hypothetical protein